MSSVSLEHIETNSLHTHDNLMQSAVWARTKERLGALVDGFRVYDERNGSSREYLLMAVHQAIGSDSEILYLPWAPAVGVREDEWGPFLEELALALQQEIATSPIAIRFDLPWRSPWHEEIRAVYETCDNRGTPILPNVRPDVRSRELRLNFGTRTHALRKAPTNVQPADTVVIDVRKSEDELLGLMHPKTRYNIRLAQRLGVRVQSHPLERLDRWYELYVQTMQRNGTRVHARRYFDNLIRAYRDAAADHQCQGGSIHLLMADLDGVPLAGMILAIQDQYAIYLYGASSNSRRNAMATYQLQWEAIRESRRLGCYWYDLFGIPSDASQGNPMQGLLRFKRGFGGRHIARLGCWDYALDADKYRHVAARQRAEAGYHGTS